MYPTRNVLSGRGEEELDVDLKVETRRPRGAQSGLGLGLMQRSAMPGIGLVKAIFSTASQMRQEYPETEKDRPF